jgi:hypothetical protein
MAVSKWLARKSFSDAANKAEVIKAAAQVKRDKNAGLFTSSQEKLRSELGLGAQVSKDDHVCCTCGEKKTQMRPSRSHLRVRIRSN